MVKHQQTASLKHCVRFWCAESWLRLNVYVRPHAVVCPKIGQASADVMSPNPSMQTTELCAESETKSLDSISEQNPKP